MRIVVFGAAGMVGSRVVNEAVRRGHEVTAVVRGPERFPELPAVARPQAGDAADPDQVARLCVGQDAAVSAIGVPPGAVPDLAEATKGLLAGAAAAGVRVLVVGGAATLAVPGGAGRTVLEDPDYLPADLRPVGEASARQEETCRAEVTADWVYVSPPALLGPGRRTGHYRVGHDELVVDGAGRSRISVEDLAVALLDEAERPWFHRTRFTVGY